MQRLTPQDIARQRHIDRLSNELARLLPDVLRATGYESQLSLNATLGGKNRELMDIANEIILSPDQFIALWLTGFQREVLRRPANSAYAEINGKLRAYPIMQRYLTLFLERMYLRNYAALSKDRPTVEQAELWIGQENASYGLLVSPRFKNGQWENDKSEIRHFGPSYWSIGHVLANGLVVPGRPDVQRFRSVGDYLTFFVNVLVRQSGSQHEMALADRYRDFVLDSSDPERVLLLIPELRYGGLSRRHAYRLDFCIVDQAAVNRVGLELSPWSSHGYLRTT